MSDHLPECERWFTDMPEPDECPACEMFRACEQRVLKENFCILSYNHALNTAREAVDRLPAPYKVRGDFDTYSSYNEGRMDMKDAVLSAIDVLRKD